MTTVNDPKRVADFIVADDLEKIGCWKLAERIRDMEDSNDVGWLLTACQHHERGSGDLAGE